MKISTIEKADKSRYNIIKWFTIAWALWFGSFILLNFITSKILFFITSATGVLAWGIFVFSLLKLLRLNSLIKKDKGIRNALSDELNLHNRNKIFVAGFWSFVVLVSVFLILSVFINIPALIVCELVLYIAVLVSLLSFLILNK